MSGEYLIIWNVAFKKTNYYDFVKYPLFIYE